MPSVSHFGPSIAGNEIMETFIAIPSSISAYANGKLQLSSIMTGWSVSELRNEPQDNQENLQWAFLPLNTAFFCLPQSELEPAVANRGQEMIDSLTAMHKATNPGSTIAAQAFFQKIKSEQELEANPGSQGISA